MVTVQTATPEQIADCVLTLKRHIDRVEADNRAKDAEIKRLRELLKAVEWGCGDDEYCPGCGAYVEGKKHPSWCPVAPVLKGADR